MPSPLTSLVETTACRLPTSTRSPTSSPSERSDSSTRPSRTSTLCETPRTATASAASAPARLAASTRRCANSLRTDWSNRSVADFSASDGEGFTNGFLTLKGLNATRRDAPNPPNVPDLQRFQAFYRRDEEEL